MKWKKVIVSVSFLVFMLFSTGWVHGQDTSASAPGPAVSSPEKKSVTPDQNQWKFEVMPYFWMAGLKGNTTIKGNDISVDMSFGDIWDNLKFGGMMYMEARKDNWGLFLDTTYVSMKGSAEGSRTVSRTVSGPFGRRTTELQVELLVDADLSLEQLYLELGGFYQLTKIPLRELDGGMLALDVLGGGRYWYLYGDLDAAATLQGNRIVANSAFSESGSKEWVDPFIGLRARINLTKKLMVVLRGDVGGFGVGSDFSWNASGYLGYSVSEMVNLWAGYKALGVDYKGGSFAYDMTMQGPSLGVSFRF